MARPHKDSDTPGAADRIREAFWEQFQILPFDQISVKDVCRKAQCNKTTFYYHFCDLREVLDSVEEECRPTEAPDLFVELLVQNEWKELLAKRMPTDDERFKRYCFLLGAQGNSEFAARTKSTMIAKWCDRLSVDRDSLNLQQRMAIDFAMGGAISVFANFGRGGSFDMRAFAEILQTSILPLIGGIMKGNDISLEQEESIEAHCLSQCANPRIVSQ